METPFDLEIFERTFGSKKRKSANTTLSVTIESPYGTRVVVLNMTLPSGRLVQMALRSNESVDLGQCLLKMGWASYALNDVNSREKGYGARQVTADTSARAWLGLVCDEAHNES
jgi:hypothetical protein